MQWERHQARISNMVSEGSIKPNLWNCVILGLSGDTHCVVLEIVSSIPVHCQIRSVVCGFVSYLDFVSVILDLKDWDRDSRYCSGLSLLVCDSEFCCRLLILGVVQDCRCLCSRLTVLLWHRYLVFAIDFDRWLLGDFSLFWFSAAIYDSAIATVVSFFTVLGI